MEPFYKLSQSLPMKFSDLSLIISELSEKNVLPKYQPEDFMEIYKKHTSRNNDRSLCQVVHIEYSQKYNNIYSYGMTVDLYFWEKWITAVLCGKECKLHEIHTDNGLTVSSFMMDIDSGPANVNIWIFKLIDLIFDKLQLQTSQDYFDDFLKVLIVDYNTNEPKLKEMHNRQMTWLKEDLKRICSVVVTVAPQKPDRQSGLSYHLYFPYLMGNNEMFYELSMSLGQILDLEIDTGPYSKGQFTCRMPRSSAQKSISSNDKRLLEPTYYVTDGKIYPINCMWKALHLCRLNCGFKKASNNWLGVSLKQSGFKRSIQFKSNVSIKEEAYPDIQKLFNLAGLNLGVIYNVRKLKDIDTFFVRFRKPYLYKCVALAALEQYPQRSTFDMKELLNNSTCGFHHNSTVSYTLSLQNNLCVIEQRCHSQKCRGEINILNGCLIVVHNNVDSSKQCFQTCTSPIRWIVPHDPLIKSVFTKYLLPSEITRFNTESVMGFENVGKKLHT